GAHRGAAGPRLSEPRRHSWHNAPDGAAPGAAPPDIPPQETLPLSDQPEGLQIVQHLGQTYRAMQAAFSSRVGHALPRWRILLTLHECGQCSQKLLAERCRLDPASLTRLLQAMQQQGWVTRSADPHDNRVTNAALTPAGQAAARGILRRSAARPVEPGHRGAEPRAGRAGTQLRAGRRAARRIGRLTCGARAQPGPASPRCCGMPTAVPRWRWPAPPAMPPRTPPRWNR